MGASRKSPAGSGNPLKKSLHVWVKVHVAVGVKTNIISAVEIHDQNANDSPQLPALLATTAKHFSVKEVSANLGYSSRENLHAIDAIGATR